MERSLNFIANEKENHRGVWGWESHPHDLKMSPISLIAVWGTGGGGTVQAETKEQGVA